MLLRSQPKWLGIKKSIFFLRDTPTLIVTKCINTFSHKHLTRSYNYSNSGKVIYSLHKQTKNSSSIFFVWVYYETGRYRYYSEKHKTITLLNVTYTKMVHLHLCSSGLSPSTVRCVVGTVGVKILFSHHLHTFLFSFRPPLLFFHRLGLIQNAIWIYSFACGKTGKIQGVKNRALRP